MHLLWLISWKDLSDLLEPSSACTRSVGGRHFTLSRSVAQRRHARVVWNRRISFPRLVRLCRRWRLNLSRRIFSGRIFDSLFREAHVGDRFRSLEMHRSFDLAPHLLLVLVTRVGSKKDLDLLNSEKKLKKIINFLEGSWKLLLLS